MDIEFLIMLTLKIKLSVILLVKIVFWGGTGENCSLGHASSGKTIGNPRRQSRGLPFYREGRGVGRDCYKQKAHWSKLGVPQCSASSLAEL